MEKGILAPYVACDEHRLCQGLVPLLPSQGRKLLEKVGRRVAAHRACICALLGHASTSIFWQSVGNKKW